MGGVDVEIPHCTLSYLSFCIFVNYIFIYNVY